MEDLYCSTDGCWNVLTYGNVFCSICGTELSEEQRTYLTYRQNRLVKARSEEDRYTRNTLGIPVVVGIIFLIIMLFTAHFAPSILPTEISSRIIISIVVGVPIVFLGYIITLIAMRGSIVEKRTDKTHPVRTLESFG